MNFNGVYVFSKENICSHLLLFIPLIMSSISSSIIPELVFVKLNEGAEENELKRLEIIEIGIKDDQVMTNGLYLSDHKKTESN